MINTERKSNTVLVTRDLYQTPPLLYRGIDAEFNFLIDVAAASYNHLAPLYIDESMDALGDAMWPAAPCWCNPPYSNIMPWVEKAAQAAAHGATVAMLVPADMSVKWFKEAWQSASEMRFISGRISFIDAVTGKPVSGNNKGSVIIIWKPEPRFISSPVVSLVMRDDLMKKSPN